MRKFLAVAFAAAAIAVAAPDQRAEAMTMAAPSALGAASAVAIQKATVVCGTNGCVPVHVSGPKKKNHQ